MNKDQRKKLETIFDRQEKEIAKIYHNSPYPEGAFQSYPELVKHIQENLISAPRELTYLSQIEVSFGSQLGIIYGENKRPEFPEFWSPLYIAHPDPNGEGFIYFKAYRQELNLHDAPFLLSLWVQDPAQIDCFTLTSLETKQYNLNKNNRSTPLFLSGSKPENTRENS